MFTSHSAATGITLSRKYCKLFHKSSSLKLLYLSLIHICFGVKVRSVELNVNQRCSSLLSSLTDINEADLAGRTAVKCALEGVTGKMITFKRADGEEYSLEYGLVDVCDVCNKEKPFPTEWITGNNNDISPEFANYALPLMRGVPEHVFEDGVPKYLYRK